MNALIIEIETLAEENGTSAIDIINRLQAAAAATGDEQMLGELISAKGLYLPTGDAAYIAAQVAGIDDDAEWEAWEEAQEQAYQARQTEDANLLPDSACPF